MTLETRGFSRVAAGFSSYDGDLSLPLGLALEEMATHSSVLAWRSLWTEEPGVLQSMGSQIVWARLSTQPHSDPDFSEAR